MNIFNDLKDHLKTALEAMIAAGELPEGLPLDRVTMEPPRDPSHGDAATNAAMVLAKPAGMKPRDLAEKLRPRLDALDFVTESSVDGPGFLNIRLADSVWRQQLGGILRLGTGFGASTMGRDHKVNVEYVSANPTGPLTAGHARGAVVGDALANLLTKAGFDVCKEYYINDAGNQVATLARSTYLRYLEALGEGDANIPEGFYPGEYLKDVGQALVARDGDKWKGRDEAEWLEPIRNFAIDFLMGEIREDLKLLGVEQTVFSSERKLVEAGKVDAVLATLTQAGHIYTGVLEPPKGKTPEDWEPRPQTLFRATDFGDDVDRPLQKSDGSWTYFANDIAYHLDKFERGYATMIDIWGADHGGYIKRMQAAVKAVTGGNGALDVKTCQLVHMFDNGKPVRMSKRAGTFVTLRDVLEAVGTDVVRFIMLTRRNDQTLEFDFAKVTEQSRDNPVFYVQYAHARAHSVLRHAKEALAGKDLSDAGLAALDLSPLADPAELALVKRLASWPRLVESAAEAHEPHRIAFYLQELAAEFHALWNKGRDDATLRFIIAEDEAVTLARMALVRGAALVIASGLEIIGVTPAEEM
ncbi:MAG: arginine--tRNA ligase [Alphaproteobacteria bacterium]|nr:arginine--tRNA ligase [Alphaproteobacteria bacterium]MBU0797116.1 arginine--tRNA ligase [Alphaproteobacteria bacterium]MBU0887923.1 arginine--tRNA ligase [Alphaproteobacteria bacterium]MBU1814854.1 arginine--tRNA ligase [Alphaproteobacteria bacterium]